jgi:ubiquinone biosynthesis protein UbiJ
VVQRGEEEDVDVCMTDPGHPVTLTVSARLRTMVDVLMGDATLRGVLRQGLVTVEGDRALARRFETLLQFNESHSFAGETGRDAVVAVGRMAAG